MDIAHTSKCLIMDNKILYIGHRGTNVDADENTVPAFEKVLNAGAHCIELDIRCTKDNELIVIHNAKIDDTTNGSGYVKDMTYSEISKFRTRNFECPIPTFDDVCKSLKSKKPKFIIDIKVRNVSPIIIDKIRKKDFFEHSTICSANFQDLALAKKACLDCKVCYVVYRKNILNSVVKAIQDSSMSFKIDMLSLPYSMIDNNITTICSTNGILPLSWGFRHIKGDTLETIKKNITHGTKGIIFDNYKNIEKIKSWLANA